MGSLAWCVEPRRLGRGCDVAIRGSPRRAAVVDRGGLWRAGGAAAQGDRPHRAAGLHRPHPRAAWRRPRSGAWRRSWRHSRGRPRCGAWRLSWRPSWSSAWGSARCSAWCSAWCNSRSRSWSSAWGRARSLSRSRARSRAWRRSWGRARSRPRSRSRRGAARARRDYVLLFRGHLPRRRAQLRVRPRRRHLRQRPPLHAELRPARGGLPRLLPGGHRLLLHRHRRPLLHPTRRLRALPRHHPRRSLQSAELITATAPRRARSPGTGPRPRASHLATGAARRGPRRGRSRWSARSSLRRLPCPPRRPAATSGEVS